MNKIWFIGWILVITLPAMAQRDLKVEDRIFNFGMTVGMKSSLPVVNSLTINNIEANDIRVEYNVGYQFAVFCRINVDRIFLQPSISWHSSSARIDFVLPGEDEHAVLEEQNGLKMEFRSLEMPVLVGYKIIKESPYSLSLMVGPKIRYNYDTDYTFDLAGSQNRFSKKSNPFDINIVMGVGVSIWRLFFDFSYEFGLNRKDSDFRNLNPNESMTHDIAINKHMNVISFSLGLLF